MEGTKLCTIAITCTLALVAGQTYNIPAGIITAHYDTVCPPDAHLDAVMTELSLIFLPVFHVEALGGGKLLI